MEANNLWGPLPDVDTFKTPMSILNEQAALLTEMTHGLLIAKVNRVVSGEQFQLKLEIVAPALQNYTFAVLMVIHGIINYPANVLHMNVDKTWTVCANETEFMEKLKRVLSSDEAKKL